nr:LOW QUALITY PROTEIN: MKI67 FHA domain-interacting nucleolar phosphoprotein [Aedes albopictus]
MKNPVKMPAVAKKSKAKPGKAEGAAKKPLILSNRSNKRTPKKQTGERNEKGIIYVKHLPHGFFENQLRTFFSQFGNVTRVHVARSKRTLRSRGYAYVEFTYREVAQIAAETMNNYLMFGKLLKTGLLPAGAKRIPKKYEKAYDANGKETTTYNLWLKKQVAKSNARVTKTKVVNRNLRALGKLKKLKEKYAKMGVDYNVDEVAPKFGEGDVKMPEHDEEEEKLRAVKDRKKSKQLQKLDQSALSAEAEEPSEDSSDEDEEAGFVSLESADWDVPMSDDEESDDEEVDEDDQKNQPSKTQTKSAAVEVAKKTKIRIDKEKSKTVKPFRPLVLRPPSSTDSSPEKPMSKKKATKVPSASVTESESSPEKTRKGPKGKKVPAKGKKVASGGITKKTTGKKGKPKEQKKATSPVKNAAKALLKDPSVKKTQAKDINKKKTKKK